FLFEKCYYFSCNFLPGSWALLYELGNLRCMQTFLKMILMPKTSKHLRNLIKKTQATDVISFHFLLTPATLNALKRLNKKINLTVVVTDPFSASTGWFYEKDAYYIVFSQQVKEFAVSQCFIKEDRVTVFPFLINPKFYASFCDEELRSLRTKHNIEDGKKVLLVTGGGGGLPRAVLIVRQLILLKPDFTVFVVCGKDVASKKVLDMLTQLYPSVDLRPLGFISNMHEMVKLCDCAVIKPGASTIFEVFSSHKPAIISTYLHGQELGNVQFAVDNKIGWFIRKPKHIAKMAYELLCDEEYCNKNIERFKNIPISTDIKCIADHLHQKNYEHR
ncbi:MAG: glycosyltransferase, partial [Spirochaetales bacterium]